MEGWRQIQRYVPELDGDGVQDLPPEDLRRFAFKMATGSGKTWVIAMAIVWSHFHKKRVPGSELSTNFLIVAPNVIVYQRLEKDFASNRIFYELPLDPAGVARRVRAEGDPARRGHRARPSGNLFLTNIHQLYESRDQEWTPQNAIEALLGKKPGKDLAASASARCWSGSSRSRPGGAQRRGPPRPRRGPGLEPVTARDPSRACPSRSRALARLLRHAQGPERDVLPLDGLRLPAGPGGGGSHRQGAADRHQGGRPQAAQAGPRRHHQGEHRREVRLLAAGRGAALEGPPERLQEARHEAGALHHGREERLRRRHRRVPLEDARSSASRSPRFWSSTPTPRARSPRRTSTRPARRRATSTRPTTGSRPSSAS